MHPAIVRRAIAAAAAITLLTVPSVFAETINADGDLLTAGFQNSFDLGTVQPGSDSPLDVFFVLTCTGTSHVDSGQMIRLLLGPRSVPQGGTYSIGSLVFPRGAGWPADGQECPAGIEPAIGGPLHIIITAPTTSGHYRYWFSWTRSLTNPTASDNTVFQGGDNPWILVSLDVPDSAANTPPTLHLPEDSTIDGNTTGGAIAAYTVTASDTEDAVPPTPVCSPPVGQVLPVGPNTISCTATDSGGLTANGSFTITVQNTPPTLQLPPDSTIDGNTTGGATAAYVVTASDIEDAVAPTPSCSPAVGEVLPVGPNTISCTVTDTNGLSATGSFTITVRNTSPTLHLPADSTIEGNTTGGATAAYVATASDVEDAVPPTPSCSPAVGAHLNLGPNTITCTATDAGGLPTTESFTITVQDTTPPSLVGMPGDVSLTTSASAATLTYTPPTATDIVDASPSVLCSTASGDTIPIGDTMVTCTAGDASGNSTSASFVAHVTQLHVGGATWEDPVGASAGIVVNGSRTIPVKVQLVLDGQVLTRGAGLLTVSACGGGAVDTEALEVQSNGRWMGHLSTDGLAAGCYRVTASVDGQAIGSFDLDVRSDNAAVSKHAKTPLGASSEPATKPEKNPKPEKGPKTKS
jgi:hypothetical protein